MTKLEQNLKKLFAAQEAVERWQDEVEAELRKIGERYMQLRNEIKGGYKDYYPRGVDTITDNGKFIHVAGGWLRRGCYDSESCDIPKELVFASLEDREEYFSKMQAQIARKAEAERRERENEERATYEALRSKFEGDNK